MLLFTLRVRSDLDAVLPCYDDQYGKVAGKCLGECHRDEVRPRTRRDRRRVTYETWGTSAPLIGVVSIDRSFGYCNARQIGKGFGSRRNTRSRNLQ
jgi:hypothetical protein